MILSSTSQPLAPSHLSSYHEPSTVEDLAQKNIDTIIQLDTATRAQRTVTERVVDAKAQGTCRNLLKREAALWTFVWESVVATPQFWHAE